MNEFVSPSKLDGLVASRLATKPIVERLPPSGAEADIVGRLESHDDNGFKGWALDLRDPSAMLELRVSLGANQILTAAIDMPRPDLAGPAQGACGFSIPLPAWIDLANASIEVHNTSSGDMVLVDARFDVLDLLQGRSSLSPEPALAVMIDVQDLLEFLKDHNGVTGIQRVVGGMVQAILSGPHERRDGVSFCEIAKGHGEVRVFDAVKLLELVEDSMAGNRPQAHMTALVGALKAAARIRVLREGDVYFIAGAYWVVPDFSPRLNALKDRGVVVGTFIYDLIPITAPDWVTAGTREAVTDRAIDVLFLSDFFLTISEFVAGEVRRLLAIEVGVVKPVHAVTLPHELPSAKGATPSVVVSDRVRDEIRNLGEFVLCVGTLEGRKNHILLFRIWCALLRRHGRAKVPVLVLVGRWGWNVENFRQVWTASNGLDGHVKILNGVGDSELAYLYQHCAFTTFASFVEGWGMPVGEALSSGAFCLCTQATSVPEVGGDFCDYFDPHDYIGAYAAFETAILDPSVISAKVRRIADEFRPRTWDAFTTELLERVRTTAAASPSVVPKVEMMRLLAFTWQALVADVSASWRTKTLKFARTSGWWEIEHWGVWAVEPRPILSFDTGVPSTDLVVALELQLPPIAHADRRISTEAGSGTTTIRVTKELTWSRIPARSDASGRVRIHLEAAFAPYVEPHRSLYIGLRSMLVYERDHAVHGPAVALLGQFGLLAGPSMASGDASNAF